MHPILLASASPARRRLLQQAGIPHRVRVSGVDESLLAEPDPHLLVQRLARAKAEAVAARLSPAEAGPVLGCDSLLLFEGEIFGKPRDADEAVARWRRMAGGGAELLTGHCLLGDGDEGGDGEGILRLATVTTRLLFARLTDAEIRAYVATGEPLQCAGGFALEGRGGQLVERIDGCVSNVIGLSLPLLRRWLGGFVTVGAGGGGGGEGGSGDGGDSGAAP
jgi:septum formation protein